MSQHVGETVSEFISRLKNTFRKAYCTVMRIQLQTHINTLLYGQLHEGLRYSLLKAAAVSGATNNIQLYVAARNKEGRQTEEGNTISRIATTLVDK